ncbi:MAG: hypothetical protein ACK4MQ_02875 [Hyphomonas sp.]
MRRAAIATLMLLPAAVAACVYAPEAPRAASPASLAPQAAPAAAASFVRLTATLPHGPSEGLPPDVLDPLEDGLPVLLDLTLLPPLEPSFVEGAGTFVPAGRCDFGPVPATSISVPTGSFHMLLDVELGSRESHAANLLSCEYDPALMSDDGPGASWRVRGCFLPHSVSIPTAVVWALNPLPASACGIGN